MSVIITCSRCGVKNRVNGGKGGSPKCGKCKNPLDTHNGANPIELDDESFLLFIKTAAKPVFVDFWASWCAPCRMMAPILEEFAVTQENIIVAKMNIERNQQTPPQFNIFAIPTMILFDKGVEVHRITSAVGLDVLLTQLRPWLGSG